MTVFLTATVVLVRVVAVWAIGREDVVVVLVVELAVARGGGFITRSTAAIAAAAARTSSGSCVVPVLVVFVGDAVVDPAIALAAARGVDDPGGFKQRSIAAVVAATATANNVF